MKCVCHGCNLRTEDCHSKCKKYEEYKEAYKKEKEWLEKESYRDTVMADRLSGVNRVSKRPLHERKVKKYE